MRAINRFISNTVVRAGSTQNVPTERIGLLNRIYAAAGVVTTPINDALRRLKHKNRRLFTIGKYAVILGVLYLFLASW